MSAHSTAELTFRSIVLAILLTLILATSNAYLALKLGILTSASIPAAIISMGILRFFKAPSILENNAVQTAASAGEAIAGGIVYTIPALIIIGYWQHFDYWTNFIIAFSGGVLGVLFSIPLRRMLVHDQNLKFPEGQAIAKVLKTSEQKASIRPIVMGGLIGGGIELAQTGFKILSASFTKWFILQRTLWGVGFGFSATMIGAGFLIGRDMAISIFSGAILCWMLILPMLSWIYPDYVIQQDANTALLHLWENKLRYVGIGGMLYAGVWTFIKLARPLMANMKLSFDQFVTKRYTQRIPRQEYDIPTPLILMSILCIAAGLYGFFYMIFPLNTLGLDSIYAPSVIFVAVLYVLIIGFLFSVMTAYFSGMVGVTASPGSSVVIAGILFAAWLLLCAVHYLSDITTLSLSERHAAEAITIIIGSMVTGIAAIANDNIQDLKVGQLVGATPWKQQVMLLIGVAISAMIIPPVMQLLFEVYGIAGVMPHDNMDKVYTLPAPTAALLAAITEAMFQNTLPWLMLGLGMLAIIMVQIFERIINLKRFINLSILGIAIGMYLPLTSSFPLFLGGILSYIAHHKLKQLHQNNSVKINISLQTGTLIACGLVAGAALMDVFTAIPFSIMHSAQALAIVPKSFEPYAIFLSIIVIGILGFWMIKCIMQTNTNQSTIS